MRARFVCAAVAVAAVATLSAPPVESGTQILCTRYAPVVTPQGQYCHGNGVMYSTGAYQTSGAEKRDLNHIELNASRCWRLRYVNGTIDVNGCGTLGETPGSGGVYRVAECRFQGEAVHAHCMTKWHY